MNFQITGRNYAYQLSESIVGFLLNVLLQTPPTLIFWLYERC